MSDRKIHWRCFHCGDTFTKAQERWAREHFGRDQGEEPVCLIRTAGEGALLTALRNAQNELAGYRAEDNDLMRALMSMQADHGVALRREEERGYEKGLADGRAEAVAGAALGEPCTLAACPPGLFLAEGAYSTLGMKSEYHTDKGAVEAYIVESGEFFWGDNPQTVERQRAQIVRPIPHDAILSNLKENGLSREGLGGLARSLPSGDAQERSPIPPLSDGGRG